MTDAELTVIYGTGAGAEALLERHGKAWSNLVFVTTAGDGTFRGQPVLAARDLPRLGRCRIFVASSFRRQILDLLEQLGIPEAQIGWYLHSDDKIISTADLRAWFVQQHQDHQAEMAQQEILVNFRDMEPEFFPLMESVKPFTMTSVPRLYDLYQTVRYLARAGIAGDLVECGVWRGGSMMLAAKTLVALGDTSRDLVLYDTFAGHPKPDADKDVDLFGNKAVGDWAMFARADGTSVWAEVSIEEVAENMASTGYPRDRIVLVKGMVEDTIPAQPRDRLALLRLDTDWYASTKVALEAFWPRLSRSGVLIVDDYGHYKGQREAVDEFFADRPVLMHRVDYSCRTIVKIESDAA